MPEVSVLQILPLPWIETSGLTFVDASIRSPTGFFRPMVYKVLKNYLSWVQLSRVLMI